ncbi:MFS transporter [Melghirimyces algeriensis]|uniref:Predicted arabinose efflux permease, MFS family n=1 Tax=Melghirimyces algeriensis TaxID=910412 RepID=A0A521BMV0_9BACL|nr:MFS transporter [Melghirimyces algeriensis]SMO48468.1 Predicted arabinose efflux permease, MFS family [Melghirimyces algeriensis]
MGLTMFSPLRQRNFGKLFIAQLFSDLGNWLDFIALNTLVVYAWGLGPEAVAALVITLGLPWVVIGPLASVWTDRAPKRLVMILSDLMRFIIVLTLFWAPNLYILLPLVFLKGACGAVFDPARQSAIRMIVPTEMLAQAVSLSQLSVQSTKILAPTLGGALVSMIGPRSTFLIEAVLFLLSAFILWMLPDLKSDVSSNESVEMKGGFWKQLREGWAYVVTNRMLLIGTLSIMFALSINFMYDGLFPLWTKQMDFSEQVFGMMISAIGFGSVLGAVLFGQFTIWQKGPLMMMSFGAIAAGSQVLLMGLGGQGFLSLELYSWFIVFLLMGISASALFVPFGYIIQTETPQRMMGRVSATANAIQNGAMLLSPSIGAFLVKVIGLGFVFSGSGICLALFGMVVLMIAFRLHKRKSDMDDSHIAEKDSAV